MVTTAERRLVKLEASLTPTELIVRWLDEAHAFSSFVAYVDSLLDEPEASFPLNRLLREAVAGVRTTTKAGSERDRATNSALRETAFRFQLALGINTATHELVEKEVLYNLIVTSQFALYLSDGPIPPVGPPQFHQILDIAAWRVTELRANAEARSIVETRYLSGHPAAFPDVIVAFNERLASAEHAMALAVRLAEIEQHDWGAVGDPAVVTERSSQLVEDLVQPARSTALEKLGDGRRALGIATGWLRGKSTRRGAQLESGSTP